MNTATFSGRDNIITSDAQVFTILLNPAAKPFIMFTETVYPVFPD